MRADLHVHSTASDGTLSPSDLVSRALSLDVRFLGIADHDTVAGLPEAVSAAQDTPLTLIPAVELSAVHDGRDVHILGYFIDHADPHLGMHLADLREARLRRATAMVAALSEAGYALDMDDVLALAAGGAIGRAHIARALAAAGHAEDVPDAFRRLIGHGRPFYIPKDVRTPQEAVAIIRSSGGLPVLAHPGLSLVSDDAVPELVREGLAGIEAFHAEHSAEQRAAYAALAARMGLLVTGGSDYHGPTSPNPEIGSVDLPEGLVDALLAARPR